MPNTISLENVSKFDGKTILYFADDYQLISIFAVADKVKKDSKIAIQKLKEQGIKTVMITGDNLDTAKSIANQVGIEEYSYEVLPEDKYLIVEKYKKQGYFTAMVGDGINDSPALKSADIGIAIGTGTDIAIDSSDIVIANGSLTAIKKAIDLSKKTFKIIKENLFWAFFYNVIGIPIAGGALAFLGVTLTPMIASIMMSLSSLFVVTNALRISKKKPNGKVRVKEQKIKETIIVYIDGMHCNHCVQKVSEALSKLKGVLKVNVDLENKKATLSLMDSVDNEKIKKVIEELGFTLNNIMR